MVSKVMSMFSIFFDIKGVVHKQFILVGQTANPAHYCDVLWQLDKNVRRLSLNFGNRIFVQKKYKKEHDFCPPSILLA
jgi:hypothetical protein